MYNQVSFEKNLELCRIMIWILMMFYNFTIKIWPPMYQASITPIFLYFQLTYTLQTKKHSKVKTNNKKWILQSLVNKKLTTKSKQ
jgi:hypothetical protein